MVSTIDRWLNRLILILLGVMFILAIFKSADRPAPTRKYNGVPDASGLISLMNTPCYQLEERLAFLRACKVDEGEDVDGGIKCPSVAPNGVNYVPATKTMADLLIKQLEDRQTSYACEGFNSDPVLNDPAKTGVLDAENPGLGWAEHQKQILEKREQSREIAEKLEEEKHDQN